MHDFPRTLFHGLCRSVPLCAALAASIATASPSIFPTGVTRYEPAKAYNSYVLVDGRDGKTHLIDMDGRDVHRWSHVGFPSEMLNPTLTRGQRGHVLVQLAGKQGDGVPVFSGIFNNREIAELDWQDNVVWKWGETAPGGAAKQNHDWDRLGNGNTLIVATLNRPLPGFVATEVHDQAIYEISKQGKIVWQWLTGDHLAEFGFSPAGLGLIHDGLFSNPDGFLTINDMQPLGPNHWFTEGDRRFNPDNIMISSRDGNFIAIIEKSSGKIVWRIGPYYTENGKTLTATLANTHLPARIDQISGAHDAHIIPPGLPGAGNLLLFDNQGEAGFPPVALNVFRGSRVLEIDPVHQQILWQYSGANSVRDVWTFDSSFIGSARRLPNGNTLICEGMDGRVFQVTPSGEIVWEFVSPYFGQSLTSEGGPVMLTNWTYRAQPIPYDWVPTDTPREEKPVRAPDVTNFHVPVGDP